MIRVWQDYMANWLDRRIPSARQFIFDARNTFIFPTGFGWLFLLLSFGLFLLGTNYQNNLMLMLCFFLAAIFLVNLFVAYLNFARIRIKLGKTNNVFAGDQLQLPLWIDQQEGQSDKAHGLLDMGFWKQKPHAQVDLDKFANPANLAFDCKQRGPLVLPRVTLSSFFPMGLFRCWTHIKFKTDILIYPSPAPCPINLRLVSEQQEEEYTTSSHAGHEDFDSLKSYRTGDPLKHVSWKHLAKGQGMVSKQFSSNQSETGWLTLPPSAAEDIELKLSQLCFQVLELSRKGTTFGLDLGPHKIEPANGAQHQQACLSALALYNKVRA